MYSPGGLWDQGSVPVGIEGRIRKSLESDDGDDYYYRSIIDIVDRDRGSRRIQLCNFEDFPHLSYIVGKSSELIMRIAM